jgi:3-hydroxyisobutyrate dehydrogenase-like beta-hydroxyacid dehydrogenase
MSKTAFIGLGRDGSAHSEEKTRNGILSTLSVNSPRKQRMSFRQRSVTYVKSFLRAFTREKRYPTCFKFRFVSSPHRSRFL